MGAAKTAAGLEEPAEQGRSDCERWVGDHVIRLSGKPKLRRIGLDDNHAIAEALPQGAGSLRV